MPSSAAPGQAPLRSSPPDRSGVEQEPCILVIAERVSVRNAVASELARNFELLHAVHFTSAIRKLSARPSVAAIIVDLAMVDGRGASWFLARLVDHAYEGPRILLSAALGREDASSLRRSSLSHFTLATPWAPGELQASITLALGSARPSSPSAGM
ncbi:hypothetical protein POL68_23120 [Stigmatella sp. ncwal1]|uniref:Response regulatory domain-containing protein n=1 Tax=Stigmatella ashevillensis TaxID=2995309 RepID=A0ABT5DCZ6_9BACT|nr:hypothetical protein [Stigmatella ashevillena]MDC0711381.1 hypothetical protein [Stigmatella ashevillena]